jgi:hypothetical protein
MSRTRFLNDPFGLSSLRKECDHPTPTQQNPLCDLLEAQINFHPTDVKACWKIQGDFKIHPLEGTNPSEPDYRELAEVLVFEVPVETVDPAYIKLKVANLSEGTRIVKIPTFDLETSLYVDIAVTNEPTGSHVPSGHCGANSIARDFSLFYDLAASPTDRLDRSVPQARGKVRLTSDLTGICRQSILLERLIERLPHAGNARPICPEVSFSGAQ